MKTFRLIGMAIWAMVMCVNFTACSSDMPELERDENGIITNQKRLVEQRRTDDDGCLNITKYSYDNKGKLLSVNYIGADYDNIYTFTWGADRIIKSRGRSATIFTLEGGLITSLSDDGGTFSYNVNKQLTEFQYMDGNYKNIQSYTWEGEKLTKIVHTETADYNQHTDEYIYELSYSGKHCKGYLPIMILNVEDDYRLWEAHPELIGMRCTQLPDEMHIKDNRYQYDESVQYAYTFDKDGYVESCTEVTIYKDAYNTSINTTIYTFKWE